MNNKYIEVILPFLKKAGKLALKNQTLITGCNKIDGSIVTETDLKISDIFFKLIKKNFEGHYILDEEKAFKEKNLKEKVEKVEYVWIIDPIDGTKAYFHGSSLFAVAISLYKNMKPVFGIIYLPSTSQIIYNDDNNVYHITNAFKRNEIKVPLIYNLKELNQNSLIHFPVKNVAEYIENYKFSFIDSYSTYVYAFDVFANIAQGAFLKDNISMWDLYSSLPIANKLGLKIYNINDGKDIDKIDFNLFKNDLKTKNIWLICHPNYKNEILSCLKKKK